MLENNSGTCGPPCPARQNQEVGNIGADQNIGHVEVPREHVDDPFLPLEPKDRPQGRVLSVDIDEQRLHISFGGEGQRQIERGEGLSLTGPRAGDHDAAGWAADRRP